MCENKDCKCEKCIETPLIDISKDPFTMLLFVVLFLGYMTPQEPIRTENEQTAFLKGKISAYEKMIQEHKEAE